MKPLDGYELTDLKRVYRTLHRQLQEDFELMDSGLLLDLQTLLQARATAEGVDVSIHAQWAAWLNDGKPVSCT
ncbi:MAG: hypothetical protein WBN57_07750 [Gammaproteobacteria bacterium]